MTSTYTFSSACLTPPSLAFLVTHQTEAKEKLWVFHISNLISAFILRSHVESEGDSEQHLVVAKQRTAFPHREIG